MGRLYDQMKRDLELRNFSPHTRRTYLACVRRFALYFHRSPEELGDPEIREYLHCNETEFLRTVSGRKGLTVSRKQGSGYNCSGDPKV